MRLKHFSFFKVVILLLAIVIFPNSLTAQTVFLEREVNYLSGIPKIDGELDSNLNNIQPREFPVKLKTNDNNPDIRVTYRLAYGADFFYVYIEAEGDKLIYRDRAYQNGDGFHMVLAKPKPNNAPTDEFYVLACSAVNKESMEWTRRIFWYYNVDGIFKRTSEDTKLRFAEKDGKISFELILPWKDVYPYHPWLSEGIGFNMCFVKAIGDKERNFYKVLDVSLSAENSKREYVNMKFEKPNHKGESQTYFVLAKNNVNDTEILSGRSVTVASVDDNEDLIFEIQSGEDYRLDYTEHKYQCKTGLTFRSFKITYDPVPAGGYKIKWHSKKNKSKGESHLTSIPEFNKEFYDKELEKVRESLSISSYQTLKHKILEIDKELNEIKPYETCGKQRIAISQMISILENGHNNIDKIADKRGFLRKAYQSKLDNTLQPYMVYIPENYDPQISYPLVIYLHGSASDETNIMARSLKFLVADGFICLSPNARGPSNCYSWDNAQDDISEAIDAVCQSYSIDKKKILLTGFSMGGYGVYRTYYETPDKFKALAVFSGHPNVANIWLGEDDLYPNFTKKEYLKTFKDVPMFIFHGKEDRNCSYETTESIIENLKKAKAKVTFISEEDKGHEPPDEKTIQEYYKWVKLTFTNND